MVLGFHSVSTFPTKNKTLAQEELRRRSFTVEALKLGVLGPSGFWGLAQNGVLSKTDTHISGLLPGVWENEPASGYFPRTPITSILLFPFFWFHEGGGSGHVSFPASGSKILLLARGARSWRPWRPWQDTACRPGQELTSISGLRFSFWWIKKREAQRKVPRFSFFLKVFRRGTPKAFQRLAIAAFPLFFSVV